MPQLQVRGTPSSRATSGGGGGMTSSGDVIAIALYVTSEKVAAAGKPVKSTCSDARAINSFLI